MAIVIMDGRGAIDIFIIDPLIILSEISHIPVAVAWVPDLRAANSDALSHMHSMLFRKIPEDSTAFKYSCPAQEKAGRRAGAYILQALIRKASST